MSRIITKLQRHQLVKQLHAARILASELNRKFNQFADFLACTDDDADVSIAIWNCPGDKSRVRTEQMLDELLNSKGVKVRDLNVASAVLDRRQMIRNYLQGGNSGN